MKVEKFLRILKGEFYLKTSNGLWKRFDKVMQEVLENYEIKLKKIKFRIGKTFAWGGRNMGKDNNEIWIFSKISKKEKEKTLIYEILCLHFEDNNVIEIKNKRDSLLIEQIAEKIWQNKKYKGIVEKLLK